MKKTLYLIFMLLPCLTLWGESTFAPKFKITGQVTYTMNETPVPGIPVTFMASDGTIRKAITDVNGLYEVVFNIKDGEVKMATGIVTDFCTEESVKVTVDSRKGLEVEADFQICDFVVPPPRDANCGAIFDYLQLAPQALTYDFTDLSYVETDAVTRTWDFGDGRRVDDEKTVRHTFKAEGLYEVSLKIEVENCVSKVTEHIFIYRDTCGCPFELEPVCVKSTDGGTRPFQNECYAFCEGYSPADLVDCDLDCGCSTQEAPVCMEIELGYQVEFPNICLAYCAGYDSSYIVTCDTIDCTSCPNYWEPVCVKDHGGDTLAFRNVCYAECHGFTPNDFIECGSETPFGNCWIDFHYHQTGPDVFEVAFKPVAPRGVVVSYLWDFGDGNTSKEESPIHTYNQGGIYNVRLGVEFENGCVAIVTNEVFVGGDGVINNPPECQAFFWFEKKGNTFYFINQSIGQNLEYEWNFGDGSSSTKADPEHIYKEPGTYLVTLKVDDGECTSTYGMFVSTDSEGGPLDECSALFLPVLEEENLTVAFMNLSSDDVVKLTWDFGDGNTSDEAFPVHTYGSEGNYNVALTIETDQGCTNTFVMMLNLKDAQFTGNPNLRTTGTLGHSLPGSLRLFPNPVAEILNVEMKTERAGIGELQIIDLSGRVLIRQPWTFVEGKNILQLNLSELPEGVFFSKVILEDEVVSMKFIK